MTEQEKKYFIQLTETINVVQDCLFKIDERLKEIERKQNEKTDDEGN